MAQKALKATSRRNTTILSTLHLTALILNLLFLLLRFLLFRRSASLRGFFTYAILSGPAFLLQLWIERIGRPGGVENGRVKAGEDLEQPGLIEYAFDVIYWTWGCLVCVLLFGERAWLIWAVIPIYAVYKGGSLALGLKRGMGGMMGGAGAGDGEADAQKLDSKRQAKLEKRGGQKVVYR